ncbi:hypothetical protein CVT24_005442 [Panaeolus cyanescens]|uniref:RING-type domain-containing protein n=1 Tax=Panaeolus cyanescens TaxID=181874 RepID=A0A409YC59_9AGAR|nr:hypothetical protein CVT24_005442 [Panaeolus cyanescens]
MMKEIVGAFSVVTSMLIPMSIYEVSRNVSTVTIDAAFAWYFALLSILAFTAPRVLLKFFFLAPLIPRYAGMDEDVLELTSSGSEDDVQYSHDVVKAGRGVATRATRSGKGVVDGHRQAGHHEGRGNQRRGNDLQKRTTRASKQREAVKVNASEVIDLTDSEPELVPNFTPARRTRAQSKKPPSNAVAGPSNTKSAKRKKTGMENGNAGDNARQQPEAGPSQPRHNPQGSPQRKRKHEERLFLDDPDEEDEDPFMGQRRAKKGRQPKPNDVLNPAHLQDRPHHDDGMHIADAEMENAEFIPWEGIDADLWENEDEEDPELQEILYAHQPPQPVPQIAVPHEPVAQPANVNGQPRPGEPAGPAQQPGVPPPPPSKDSVIAQVLEIIPNVCPNHLSNLIDRNLPQFGAQTSELVIGMLFEDPNYPKAEKRGVKRVAGGEGQGGNGGAEGSNANKKQKVDFKSLDREVPGVGYEALALATLKLYFAHIPHKYLSEQLKAHRSLYAPTYLSLLAAERRYAQQPRLRKPYERSAYTKAKGAGKGKGKAKAGAAKQGAAPGHGVANQEGDDEGFPPVDEIQAEDDVRAKFEEELVWLEGYLASGGDEAEGQEDGDRKGKGKGKERAVDREDEEGVEGEAEIECGCCFCEYPFSQMVQCPEAHLFCKTCLTTYASNQLSSLSCAINCMSSNPPCEQPFPPSELRRVLPENLLKLYDRVKQQDEIAKAGLEGLEECPFCEWKCVIEVSVEEDKLFRCGNEDGGCGVVSCRMCKKPDHVPKSCQEVEEDKVLDGRHTIEEAMTAAMMRNCPKCKKAFIKENGCNKMTCPHCHTLSCYVCRQIIRGYDHFDQMPGAPGTSKKAGKCSLWDKVEERAAEEVKAAHDRAMAKYREEHPDVETDALKVDLPKAPPPPPPPPQPVYPHHHPPARRGQGRARVPAGPPAFPLAAVPPQARRAGRRVAREAAAVPAPRPIRHVGPVPAHGVAGVQLPGFNELFAGPYNPQVLAGNNPGIAHLLPPNAPPPLPQQHNFIFQAIQGRGAEDIVARAREDQERWRQQQLQMIEQQREARERVIQQQQQQLMEQERRRLVQERARAEAREVILRRREQEQLEIVRRHNQQAQDQARHFANMLHQPVQYHPPNPVHFAHNPPAFGLPQGMVAQPPVVVPPAGRMTRPQTAAAAAQINPHDMQGRRRSDPNSMSSHSGFSNFMETLKIPFLTACATAVGQLLWAVAASAKARKDDTQQPTYSLVEVNGGRARLSFRIARVVGIVALLLCSVISLRMHQDFAIAHPFQSPEAFMTCTYLYTLFLSLIALVSQDNRWRSITSKSVGIILLTTWGVYAYRDLWPLATYTLEPVDLFEGHVLWLKVSILTVIALVLPLFIPCRYVPVDPKSPMPTPSYEQTASWISFLTFSFMNPLIHLGSRVPHIPVDALPPLLDTDDAHYLTGKAFPQLDRFSGAPDRHIIWGLLRYFSKSLVTLYTADFLIVIFGLVSPIALNKLLRYLETNGLGEPIRPWVWIILLLAAPTARSISEEAYLYQSTQLRYRFKALVIQLVFEHSLRIRLNGKANGKSKGEDDESNAEDGNIAGRINNAVTTDADNVIGGIEFTSFVITAPVSLILSIALLYQILGWSSTVALALMLVLVPLSASLGSFMQTYETTKMEKTDARIQRTSEVVSVLRMIKLFGWERKMNEIINSTRREELVWFRKLIVSMKFILCCFGIISDKAIRFLRRSR